MTDNSEVIKMLREWAAGKNLPDGNKGICYYIVHEIDYYPSGELLQEFFKSWEFFSGNESFPVLVKANAYITQEELIARGYESVAKFQYYTQDLWKGGQLKMRQSLCTHIANCLEELDNRNK